MYINLGGGKVLKWGGGGGGALNTSGEGVGPTFTQCTGWLF